MKIKKAVFKTNVAPAAQGLPRNKAASIGRIVARHAFLENQQAKIIYMLLGISQKQGRIIIRVPQPRLYVAAVKSLMQFHEFFTPKVPFDFTNYARLLDKADAARNTLAHSIFWKHPETKQLHIQIVRGNWELAQDVETVSRALRPENRAVTREFLKELRRDIESALKETAKLFMVVGGLLKALNEIRRTQPALDRRRPQSQSTPQSLPLPFGA